MKLDKDTLVKHQFWILLGSYLLVWLIAMSWLKVAAGPEIEKVEKEYKDKEQGLKTAKQNPINTATFLPPWEKASATFNGHKSVIWKDAWAWQAGMYDWPKSWEKMDMTTPQTDLSADQRSDYRHKWYPQQIENLRKNAPDWLYPVELADGFDEVFQPQKWEQTPTREEIWLAQEDFWVKRELLWVVYGTMANLAFMQPAPIGEEEKAPEGIEGRYRYRNQNWEITLNLRKNKEGQLVIGGDSTIKNLDPNHRPQPLTSAKGEGIRFSVVQDRTRTEFEVRGEPVGWNETRAFSVKDNEPVNYEPLDGIVWDKIKERPVYVSQGFDHTNSPIRSLSSVALGEGAQDSRTYSWMLQPNHTLAQLDALPENADGNKGSGGAPGGMPGGAPGGVPGSPPGGMPGGPPGGAAGGQPPGMPGAPGMPGGAAAPTGNPTPNNQLERNRYLQPADLDKKLNPPSRHLPLALRLVVMQSHMHDVLLALANSRLRVQITQVEFHHAKDYMPQGEGDKKDGADGMGFRRVFTGAMPGMMYGSMGMGPNGPRGMPGSPPRMPGSAPGMRMPGSMMASPPMMMPPTSGSGRGKFRPTMAPGIPMPNPPQPGGDGDSKQAVQNPQDDNLAEITVYGIAVLYRHPDPPKTNEQSGQPGQTGQPAQPGQSAPSPGQPQPGRPAGQQAPAPPPPPPGNKP